MSKNDPASLVFDRRSMLMAGAGGLMFSGLVARLFQLQILEHEKYETAAKENGVRLVLSPPKRGDILDRFGRPIAAHRKAGRVSLVPEQVGNVEALLKDISNRIELTPARQERIMATVRRQARFQPAIIADELSYEDFAKMSLLAPEMSGVQVEMASTRSYPRGRDFAHVLGYVARANQREMNRECSTEMRARFGLEIGPDIWQEWLSGLYQDRRVSFFKSYPDLVAHKDKMISVYAAVVNILKHPDMRIGRSGVELRAEEWLRGQSGWKRVESNAAGRIIRELPSEDLAPIPGRDLYLTVDAELQKFAIDRFGDESGAAVVLDIETGDILSFVSTPAFDPNDFVNGISQADYDALLNNDRSPLYHKAYDGTYPPGSTYKMVVAAAALEEGVINPQERIYCNRTYRFGNRTWHCWKKGGHGSVNMHDAIKGSCDVYFYEIARRLGVEKIANISRRFGFGQTWDLGITGGRSGVVPDDAWKRKARGEKWYEGETLNYGIGQGYLTTTPLQLALMTARIAAEGRLITPRIIGEGPAPEGSIPHDAVLDAELMQRMKAGMFGVTSEWGGTALRSGDLGLGGPRLAGKTGTAQVRRITAAERASGILKGDQIERKLRDHALFVAYAPHDDPKYAISVIVEHGEGGSRAAAPVARDILAHAIKTNARRSPVYAPVASHSAASNSAGGL